MSWIERYRELKGAATPGPWDRIGTELWQDRSRSHVLSSGGTGFDKQRRDLDFVAAAVNDLLPAAVEECEGLRRSHQHLTEVVAGLEATKNELRQQLDGALINLQMRRDEAKVGADHCADPKARLAAKLYHEAYSAAVLMVESGGEKP